MCDTMWNIVNLKSGGEPCKSQKVNVPMLPTGIHLGCTWSHMFVNIYLLPKESRGWINVVYLHVCKMCHFWCHFFSKIMLKQYIPKLIQPFVQHGMCIISNKNCSKIDSHSATHGVEYSQQMCVTLC